jgi:hypothetical protein
VGRVERVVALDVIDDRGGGVEGVVSHGGGAPLLDEFSTTW